MAPKTGERLYAEAQSQGITLLKMAEWLDRKVTLLIPPEPAPHTLPENPYLSTHLMRDQKCSIF